MIVLDASVLIAHFAIHDAHSARALELLDTTPDISDDAKRLIVQRERVRDEKDWRKSDELRDELLEQGIVLRDTPSGTIWTYGK